MKPGQLQESQNSALDHGTAYIGRMRAEQAGMFARRHELYVTHYDAGTDTWRMSDGEVYSTSVIIRDNAENLIRELDAE